MKKGRSYIFQLVDFVVNLTSRHTETGEFVSNLQVGRMCCISSKGLATFKDAIQDYVKCIIHLAYVQAHLEFE